jgi:hypothetical protein
VHASIDVTSVPASIAHEHRVVLSLFLVPDNTQVSGHMCRSDAFADLADAA